MNGNDDTNTNGADALVDQKRHVRRDRVALIATTTLMVIDRDTKQRIELKDIETIRAAVNLGKQILERFEA